MSVFIKGNNYEFLDLDLTSQAGISSQASRQELHKILSKYGKIVRLKTGYQDFAFVDYELDRSAFSAVKALNGTNLLGSRVTVQIAKKNQQHHSHNNNNWNERARTLSADDLLYHRKEELERRPRNVTEPREQNRFDDRTTKHRDNSPLMNGDQRPVRFNHFTRPQGYRGRSRPFSFPHSRGSFRPPPMRQYSPQRIPHPRAHEGGPRSRSPSRSHYKSRSSSPSFSFSRSRYSSPSVSRSRASSRSKSPQNSPNRESRSPKRSPGPRTEAAEIEAGERVVTRRAQSLDPPSIRRWNSVNLSGSASIKADDAEKRATSPVKEKDDEAASNKEMTIASEYNVLHTQDTKQMLSDDEHTLLLEIERRLKVEEQRSAQLEQRLEGEQQRAEEERLRRGDEERQRRDEMQRVLGEQERLQRECERLQHEYDKLRVERDSSRAERDQFRAENERLKVEHNNHRKRTQEEIAQRVESERQLRVTAERALEDERARHQQSESALRRQFEALQQQAAQSPGTSAAVPAASESTGPESVAESDSADKTHKRKATQQLGTKPKRRKTESGESVASKKKSREVSDKHDNKHTNSVPTVPSSAPSLVLDLTDE